MAPYYADESVTLFHGDCREIDAWLSADVLVTDPPYGMGYVSNASRYNGPSAAIVGDATTVARDEVLALWGDRPALVFGTWRVPRPASVQQVLVWDKGESPGMGNLTIPWGTSHEEVYVLGAWPPIRPGGRRREGGNPARSVSVLRAQTLNSQAHARPAHPTPKPVSLMEQLVQKCPPGVIADPFAGSGATLLAARAQGRRAVGVELEERYCDLIASRLAQGDLFGGVA